MKIEYLLNNKGRDFVCGDLHGCFDLLEKKLASINFNPQIDRLFSVGDIIDRGADSAKALDYLSKSWFHCIRGNHEQMFLDWCSEDIPTYRSDAFRLHVHNGGLWIADYLGVHIQKFSDDINRDELITDLYPQLNQWIDALNELPYAIEINQPNKKIGIIHAELPESVQWPNLEEELKKTNVRYSILFSRKYFLSRPSAFSLKRNKYQIKGVDEIYCGHTVVDKPQTRGNVNYIDTGAYSQNNLTLCELKDKE